jgi:hypothetical protein
MVYGSSMSRCSCGKSYITGDCIELDGLCPECRESLTSRNPCKVVDLTYLTAHIMTGTCEECRIVPASWRCPNCGFKVCTKCQLMFEGHCHECPPKFEAIEEEIKDEQA